MKKQTTTSTLSTVTNDVIYNPPITGYEIILEWSQQTGYKAMIQKYMSSGNEDFNPVKDEYTLHDMQEIAVVEMLKACKALDIDLTSKHTSQNNFIEHLNKFELVADVLIELESHKSKADPLVYHNTAHYIRNRARRVCGGILESMRLHDSKHLYIEQQIYDEEGNTTEMIIADASNAINHIIEGKTSEYINYEIDCKLHDFITKCGFTATQKRIISYMSKGYLEESIAKKLNCSQPNINKHKKAIRKKLKELNYFEVYKMILGKESKRATKQDIKNAPKPPEHAPDFPVMPVKAYKLSKEELKKYK